MITGMIVLKQQSMSLIMNGNHWVTANNKTLKGVEVAFYSLSKLPKKELRKLMLDYLSEPSRVEKRDTTGKTDLIVEERLRSVDVAVLNRLVFPDAKTLTSKMWFGPISADVDSAWKKKAGKLRLQRFQGGFFVDSAAFGALEEFDFLAETMKKRRLSP